MKAPRIKRIKTTLAKAKALRRYVEPLITRSKNDTVHNRRMVFKALQDKYTVQELFGAIAEKVADRPGGYTRIFKVGFRHGDGAEMAIIELVDFNEDYSNGDSSSTEESSSKKRTRRSKKKGGGDADVSTAEETVAETSELAEEVQAETTFEEVAEVSETTINESSDVEDSTEEEKDKE